MIDPSISLLLVCFKIVYGCVFPYPSMQIQKNKRQTMSKDVTETKSSYCFYRVSGISLYSFKCKPSCSLGRSLWFLTHYYFRHAYFRVLTWRIHRKPQELNFNTKKKRRWSKIGSSRRVAGEFTPANLWAIEVFILRFPQISGSIISVHPYEIPLSSLLCSWGRRNEVTERWWRGTWRRRRQ